MVRVTPIPFIRDYETVKVEQEVPNEFLLSFYDEAQPPMANYKKIERNIVLGDRRVGVDRGSPFPLIVVSTNGFPSRPQETYNKRENTDAKYVGMGGSISQAPEK